MFLGEVGHKRIINMSRYVNDGTAKPNGKAAASLLRAEAGRPCKCSQPCKIAPRRSGGWRAILNGGAGVKATQAHAEAALVSVICPTVPERRALHPMVYACFAAQTHPRCELDVFESDGEPSDYWRDVAKRNARVRYRQDPADHVTVGAKRNRLLADARGEVIAMFDDDNVYASTYLEVMLRHLRHSGYRLVSLSGFCGVNTATVAWEYHRNVGGRGETQLFYREGAAFDETVTWGEEGPLLERSKPLGCHRVWDDVGIFLHVDHGLNATLMHPDSAGADISTVVDTVGTSLRRCGAGIEWRPATRTELNAGLLAFFDEWGGVFYRVAPTPIDPAGETPPGDWFALPEARRAGVVLKS